MTSVRNYGWFVIIGLASCLGGISGARAADPAELRSKIEKLAASPRVGRMQVGIRVELLGEKPVVVYEQNADASFKPASNQKIVTSAAAMTLLPADFTYHTILGRRGEDLVIIGAGDPSCGDGRLAKADKHAPDKIFQDWAAALKAKGITRIGGNLLFDDFIFEQQHMNPSWPKQFNLQDWYCAPVGGLNLNDNCVEVIVKRGEKVGDPADVTLHPASSYMKLTNTTKTASKGEPNIKRSPGDPTSIVVSGPVSKGNDINYAPSIAVADPGLLFASACKTALAQAGIEIAGEVKRERIRGADLSIPAGVETIATYDRKLIDIMWRVNKSSLNVFAEGLLKTVGAYDETGRAVAVGGYETGRARIKKMLDAMGIKSEGIVIDDGSGLSHGNRVTPAMLTTILRHMHSSPRREEWWGDLAVPGEKEGTLRRRLKGYEGKVFAKTGSINAVSALSGYVKSSDGRIYAFSVLCNDTNKSKGMAPHELQDGVCKILAGGSAPLTATPASKPATEAKNAKPAAKKTAAPVARSVRKAPAKSTPRKK